MKKFLIIKLMIISAFAYVNPKDSFFIKEKLKFRYLLLMILYCCNFYSNAQNIVPNSSFENFLNDSIKYYKYKDWKIVNKSGNTPDFNCYKENLKTVTPFNTTMKTGIACMGLDVYPLAESVEVHLKDTLKKDSIYKISMFVKLKKENCVIGVTSFIVYLTDSLMSYNKYKKNAPVLLRNSDSTAIINSTEWVRIEEKYKAKGGECFLILGSYKKKDWELYLYYLPILKQQQKLYDLQSKERYMLSYYFIDDVEIELSPMSQSK